MRMRTIALRAAALAGVLFMFSAVVAQADGFIEPTGVAIHALPGTEVPAGTEVTISGKLRADHAFCRIDTDVTLRAYGESHGDRFPGGVVARTTTGIGGSYEFQLEVTEQIRVRVWFRGKVGGVHPDIKTCRKSRSDTVTLHAG